MSRAPRHLSVRSTHDAGGFSVDAELHEAGAVLRVTGLLDPSREPWPAEVRITVRGEPALDGAPLGSDRPPALRLTDRAAARAEGSASDVLERLASGFVVGFQRADHPDEPALVALLSTMRRHLLRRCEPEARREAARYSPWSHWFLYRRLVADTSGRIVRASRTHPGLVALACGVESYDWWELADQLFHGIAVGEEPAALVDRFLRLRVEDDPTLYGVLDARTRELAERWLETEPCSPIPLERAELQRRFLLFSGPELPVFLYAEPPPAGLLPSQLPRTRAERRQHRRLRDLLRSAGWSERTRSPARFRDAVAWLARHPRANLDGGRFGAWLLAGGELTRRTRPIELRRESVEFTPVEFGMDPA